MSSTPRRSTRGHRPAASQARSTTDEIALPARRSRRGRVAAVAGTALAATLALPASALAVSAPDEGFGNNVQNIGTSLAELASEVNMFWLIFGAALVFLMQLGFLGLELGFSRGKNVGSGVAKIFVNLSVASIVWWALGFGLAFGGNGDDGLPGSSIIGGSGFFFQNGTSYLGEAATNNDIAFMFFQFTFAAVSLAIVWGSTLERIKFIVYPIFAVVFVGFIYPVVAHWGFGAGIFSEIGAGALDFAGSTVVHLTGATAALAAALVLGPRIGKYDKNGKPRAIPGHSMPIFAIGVILLWVGWFGFNGASTVATDGAFFAHVILSTNLAAAAGAIAAMITIYALTKSFDVGMIGNGAIAGLVSVTAPSGWIEVWAAVPIGLIGGVVVVFGVLAFDRLKVDDPVGATSAHGLAGIWGTLACGFFASDRLVLDPGQAGLFYGGGLGQLGTQALTVIIAFTFVFIVSYAVFKVLDMTIGIRVSEEAERAGLDISEHGMYGYPEQFIPEAELVGAANAAPVDRLGVPSKEIPA